MAALDSLAELNSILEEWNNEVAAAGFATSNPVPKITRLAEIVERETEAYYKMDPDPFDDRHPGRANPTCTLGHLFKALFKHEEFMNRLVCEYLLDPHGNPELCLQSARVLYDVLPGMEKRKDFYVDTLVSSYVLHVQRDATIQTLACRLLYDILPGLETSVVFQETEGLVEQLFKWSEKAHEPLRTYATGLLAGAMELQDVAANFKDKNSALVSVMIQRLHALQNEMHEEYLKDDAAKAEENKRNFSMFGSPSKMSSPGGVFMSPKGKLPKSVKTEYCASTAKSETKMEKSPTKEIKKDPEKLAIIEEYASMYALSDSLSHSKPDIQSSNQYLPDQAKMSECSAVGQTDDIINIEGKLVTVSNGDNKPIVSQSQIPGCSNDETHSVKQVEDEGSGPENNLNRTNIGIDNAVVNSEGNEVENKFVNNVDRGVGNMEHHVDSEDEERYDDITVEDRRARLKRTLSPSFFSEDVYRLKYPRNRNDSFILSDVSNSSWAELQPYVIGSYSLEPLTLGMKQRLILQYLTPMGEYQELISAAFEHRAMDLVFYYINLKYNRDVRLAFEALKYLAVLLCHKKFAIEFLNRGGVQKLLDVYRPSIAATGVSLCLYYLSYFEDAMERVCLLSDHILTTLVNYVLWLMECSHDSSRCHAAMFFTQSFPFLVILNRFDVHDGLRRLYNVMSTLGIMNVDSSTTPGDDQVFTMRQSARHVCVALKKYFESHLILKVNELKRSHARNEGGSPQHETPAYKAIKMTAELIQENIELMMELMPVRQQWQPESTFYKLGGITLLAQLVGMAPDWSSYTGKPETLKAALDVIGLCCVTPKSQLQLLSPVPLPENHQTPAISIFIGLAEGDVMQDPDVQRSALSVIINCVCGPLERLGGGVGRYMGSGSKKKINWKLGEDVLAKMWNGIRENNGIMVLLKLLSIKTPITDADSIRALACKALVGMARSETVRQIISKLPLFSNGQLQLFMKEPILQDKRLEHVKFCRYATELIEKVSGKQTHKYSDASLDDIRKADIVAQSKINYNEKELLQLIYDHLQSKGYHEAADVLHREASLPRCITPPPLHPSNPQVFAPVHSSSPSLYSPTSSGIAAPRALNRQLIVPNAIQGSPAGASTLTNLPVNQVSQSGSTPQAATNPHSSQPTVGQPSSTPVAVSFSSLPSPHLNQPVGTYQGNEPCLSPPPASTARLPQVGMIQQGTGTSQPLGTLNASTGPIRFSISKQTNQQQHTPVSSAASLRTIQHRSKYVKERDSALFSPAVRKGLLQKSQVDYEMSLDKIVTEYLRKQHALCRNPVVTCPPMSLFQPHQCPEPRGNSYAPISFTARTYKKMLCPKYGGADGCKLDRKFIYSRFKPIRTYKEAEDDGFSCCTFANTRSSQQYLMLGTYGGNLKLINTQSTEETGSFHCHPSPVTHCEHSRDGKLVLTASSYGIMYSSALWSWGAETLDKVFDFEDNHLEFSILQDRLIGTKDEVANIYDITTGDRVLKLFDADKANNYKANRAIFNPTDDLVLNDGVLWDIRLAKAVHKFDKFNQYVSGVFHPVGFEIIINSEVWDIRSFRLLHTVPALDQCQIRFNYLGDVMYATRIDEELDHDSDRHSPYGSTFRTFDATNYAAIATMDVKSRSISDLCTDTVDTYLAVVENQQSTDIGADENICRLYEIGKVKDEDDDQQAEEEEEQVQDEDDDDDDDDDDDEFMLNDDDDDDDENDDNTGDNEEEDDDDVILSIDEDDDDDDDADFDLDGIFELADL